jgi:hypothetical protein
MKRDKYRWRLKLKGYLLRPLHSEGPQDLEERYPSMSLLRKDAVKVFLQYTGSSKK